MATSLSSKSYSAQSTPYGLQPRSSPATLRRQSLGGVEYIDAEGYGENDLRAVPGARDIGVRILHPSPGGGRAASDTSGG